jgi:TetR/AcrR family transcriptional regulator
MNDENLSPTEQKIFDAARQVFQTKGLEGARMQEIADKASINKSMLHYYYRSKDKLFEKVYQLSILKLVPEIVRLLNKDLPLDEKLRQFVKTYMKILRANPDIPLFIVHELNKNPDRLKTFVFNEVGRKVEPFLQQLREEHARGRTVDLPPEQIIMNIMSQIIFPFLGKPVLQVMLGKDEAGYAQLMADREELLPDYIVSTVIPKS